MEKYAVIGTLGEGSFGRVYKAKRVCDGTFVALKVISKRGRSLKELKGFRRECEIQRDLHHPNIVQMLDSFETENEIVVITEFVHNELTAVLGKEGFLPEEKVQPIVWDLVSALYYLHSHRVLHRDLKPQNILLDQKNRVKLCDFGFARNMSTGTHVLTSIKGTPLYMAPELIDEQPYDYSADLWSLGCIIYELLMGMPPFCTSSILHLIRLIRHEHIQWPTFLSEQCISFLKGLLQKNPSKRMTWDEILNHPFVKGHILVLRTSSNMPLTKPLTSSTMQVKEQQRKDSVSNKPSRTSNSNEKNDNQKKNFNQSKSLEYSKSHSSGRINEKTHTILDNKDSRKSSKSEPIQLSNDNKKLETTSSLNIGIPKDFKSDLNFIEDSHPIEAEEWIVFLQKTIQEVISGEMFSLLQPNLANVLVTPLRNSNSSSKILGFVAKLFALPLALRDLDNETIEKFNKVYFDVKLVPNLVYATKLFLRIHREDSPKSTSDSPAVSVSPTNIISYKDIDELTDEDLQALECICVLITRLVYTNSDFLLQFCDSVAVLNVYKIIRLFLLLVKRRLRIVIDVIAILTEIIRKLPENSNIVEKILTQEFNNPESTNINLVEILRHSNAMLRERACYLLLFMGKQFQEDTMKLFWNVTVRETVEALVFDSIEGVRNAAEACVSDLKNKEFYNK